jgi:type I restriction enzyme S subunit
MSLVGNPGAVAIVPDSLRGANLARQAALIALKPDVDARYVMYWFMSPLGRERLASVIKGSVQQVINLADLKRQEVRLPPLETQRRIASILSAYDDLIEVNRRRVALLEEMARGLFEEWFVRFRFPEYEDVAIVDTPKGPLPQGWYGTTVSSAFSLSRGRSYRSIDLADAGGMPFVNLKCILRDGGFKTAGIKRYTGEYKVGHVVMQGDMVMAVTDMTQDRRIVGRVGRIPLLDEPEAVISMDLVKVLPAPNVDRTFLYCWLRYSGFGLQAAQHANGANVLHLSPKAVVDLPICLPPFELQTKFGEIIEPLMHLAEVLAIGDQRLNASRELLLPRLISGQLSVSAAERQLEEAA